MPITPETKAILKKEIEEMQKDKKKYQDQLNTLNRDIARLQNEKTNAEKQIAEIDRRTVQFNKDMNVK